MVLHVEGLGRVIKVNPMHAAGHVPCHEAIWAGQPTERKHTILNRSDELPIFGVVHVPFDNPPVAATGQEMAFVTARCKGVNGSAMAAASGYFFDV